MSFADIAAAAARWRGEGRAAAVIEVAAHKGSVPRETGTRMLVSVGETIGTVGGGHLELHAIEAARQLIATRGAPITQHVPLGPALGQCCGGVVDLKIARLEDDEPEGWAPPAPRFTLRLYGAGHVGRAIVKLLDGIDCRVSWIDEREEEFPADPLPRHIEKLCVEPVEAEVDAASPGDFHLVLTHSHALDERITKAILERGDFGFFGLIGSRTKRARFEHRMLERGIAKDLLDRMVCPIGVPGITGKEPEVLAIAVVAQLLQRSGR